MDGGGDVDKWSPIHLTLTESENERTHQTQRTYPTPEVYLTTLTTRATLTTTDYSEKYVARLYGWSTAEEESDATEAVLAWLLYGQHDWGPHSFTKADMENIVCKVYGRVKDTEVNQEDREKPLAVLAVLYDYPALALEHRQT